MKGVVELGVVETPSVECHSTVLPLDDSPSPTAADPGRPDAIARGHGCIVVFPSAPDSSSERSGASLDEPTF